MNTDDYAKCLAEIEATIQAWQWYCDDNADPAKRPEIGQATALRDVESMATFAIPWLLSQLRAASEALTALGVPEGGSLVERVRALANTARHPEWYTAMIAPLEDAYRADKP